MKESKKKKNSSIWTECEFYSQSRLEGKSVGQCSVRIVFSFNAVSSRVKGQAHVSDHHFHGLVAGERRGWKF